ncbi:hypothetical protein NP493_643g01038 [Ridgeia piscesae]|uniref:Deltamethrin resistance protein prag01 domain-containing protein n=1 Tax=Ridgeia piscesae TaxID=27915 RepID=A0AAD9KSY2_RIDPI|nr:hypothetical protein NP493_643g01038 [Ridgeia piscesae]
MCSRALISSGTLMAAVTASGRQVARRSMASKAPAVWKSQAELARLCRTTVNDLPIPAGSWRANYNRQQARWNRNLAANVAFFLFTLAAKTLSCRKHVIVSVDDSGLNSSRAPRPTAISLFAVNAQTPNMIRATKVAMSLRAAVRNFGRRMTTLAPTEYKSQADLARIYRRTLNELPVPAGPWAKTYAERNTKYNRQLAASMIQTETIYLHWRPDFKSLKINPNKPSN